MSILFAMKQLNHPIRLICRIGLGTPVISDSRRIVNLLTIVYNFLGKGARMVWVKDWAE